MERVMSWQVVSVEPEADVIDVAALMANRGIHPIPVLKVGILLGIIDRADVVRAMLDLARAEESGSAGTGAATADS
ncbi:MAG: CBS domain-containing protein [Thermomicrobiaceae bacterium]|nr:CBS domain-containing protein [Thermomicrobiaceae bacterium]